jgi:hypothetical protein|tara:strand:- start:35 stop:214 length:180 start_codon:yes stop_codon:yes gene_type:complete
MIAAGFEEGDVAGVGGEFRYKGGGGLDVGSSFRAKEVGDGGGEGWSGVVGCTSGYRAVR